MSQATVDLTRTQAVAEANAGIVRQASTFDANHQRNIRLEPGEWAADRAPMKPLPLDVDMKVKFLGDRRWWTVEAVNDACAVLTRPGDFARQSLYTIISWTESRRGPQTSWGLGGETREQCEETAEAYAAGKTTLSQRHSVYLDLEAVRP